MAIRVKYMFVYMDTVNSIIKKNWQLRKTIRVGLSNCIFAEAMSTGENIILLYVAS